MVFAVFDFFAQVRSVNQHHLVFITAIHKQDGDIGTCSGKNIGGHGNDASQHFVLHQIFTDALIDPRLRRNKAGWHYYRSFTTRFKRVDDVLQEQLVNFHLVLGFGFNLGNSGKEAFFVFFVVQLIAKIAEIHLERWIRDDVVKFFQVLAVFVIGVQHGIPLNYIRD